MTSPFALRLQFLRDQLTQSSYDGFLVPMADEFQSEYVPASAQRIQFLSGFTGSAGFIIVLKDKAGFFTDGRYVLQAHQQVPTDLFQIYDSGVFSPTAWLIEHAPPYSKIAYDPWLHTAESITKLTKTMNEKNILLMAVTTNPIDAIWKDRPPAPTAPLVAYDIRFAGKSSSDKRAMIAEHLAKKNLSAAVLTDPTSVAWLLNIRGGDVANTPLPLSFAIVDAQGAVQLFVDPRKGAANLSHHLGCDVSILPIDQFSSALEHCGSYQLPIRIDPTEAASAIVDKLKSAHIKLDLGDDPCLLPKACKNDIEIEGMRAAHRRDGAALVTFLSWLEKAQIAGDVSEISADEKLASFRAQTPLYQGPSFDTISGVGAHGAIIHYRATPTTNRLLETGQLYLLDSGGQYLDGTTDVTRTIALGLPTQEMRDRYTRVLKGHIALAAIRFPEGTAGSDLDVLARQYLWAVGLDYNHGTGHGVGSYLGVHEGPQGISKRNHIALVPGMVVSNEPGYYKTGHYGIRLENLQLVTSSLDLPPAEKKMLGFESLTLVPFDRHLVDRSLLTEEERLWINTYHTKVRDQLNPLLDNNTRQWLDAATQPLA